MAACGSKERGSDFSLPRGDEPALGKTPVSEVDAPAGDGRPGFFDRDAQAVSAVCGGGSLDEGEACDDGNSSPLDGCSDHCSLEPGWKCPLVGAACSAAACGDGVAVGDEDCDDGNSTEGDGCSSVCTTEEGWACGVSGCFQTVCGDGKVEGTEECDDGAKRPYDGCSPQCTREPNCASGTCVGACGDGIQFPGEACDDGNTRSGDGCSSQCAREPGFTCAATTSDLPPHLDVPILYRDFRAAHPDFETFCCGVVPGIVKASLGAGGRPEFANQGWAQSSASFDEWYRDVAGVNEVVLGSLRLQKQANDSYVYDNGAFFPLDGLGFGNEGKVHNFHFTSELRTWFTYKGGEVLDFRGDDDVWVFIHGRLAVDLGGVHGAADGSVTLDAAAAGRLQLVLGQVYEAAVFQAERHTTESSYKLTLRGFEKSKTSCTPICGDGLKTKYEACDDGHNTGGYGECAPGCALGPRCGDGIVQREFGEDCDDGNLRDGDTCSRVCRSALPN